MKKLISSLIAIVLVVGIFAVVVNANTMPNNYGTIIRVNHGNAEQDIQAYIEIIGDDGYERFYWLDSAYLFELGSRVAHTFSPSIGEIGPVGCASDFEGLEIRYSLIDTGISRVFSVNQIELLEPLPQGWSIRPLINQQSGWHINLNAEEMGAIMRIDFAEDERIRAVRDGFSFDDYFLIVRKSGVSSIVNIASARDFGDIIGIEITTESGFGPPWITEWGPAPTHTTTILEIPREFSDRYIGVSVNGDSHTLIYPLFELEITSNRLHARIVRNMNLRKAIADEAFDN